MRDLAFPRARLAGFLYLVVIGAGAFSIGFLHGAVIVPGDAHATAAKLLASELLWRLGIVAQLVMYGAYVGVTVIFLQLFKPVQRTLSLFAALISLVGISVGAANILNQQAPLIILKSASVMSAPFDQASALAYLFLRLQNMGFTITLIFFGVYCVLIGILIMRSTFLPRSLGILLALGGVLYISNSLAVILSPELARVVSPYGLVASVGELAVSIWLFVRGVNATKWNAQAQALNG